MSNHPTPTVVRDPRFRAGRTCMQKGKTEQAVEIFALLLQEARRAHGDTAFESMPAYYEYGNALFRNSQKEEEKEPSNAREAAAAAAEKRAQTASASKDEKQSGNKNEILDSKKPKDSAQEDLSDAELALEMMETAWSILDQSSEDGTVQSKYTAWVREQCPRVLTGLGDVLSALERHADAVDVYCRALKYRQENVELYTTSGNEDSLLSLDCLKCRRLYVETNVLIAEELLMCPDDQDVVTTETKEKLVPAGERVEYARGYYDKAREELQETVLLMGQIAAKGLDIEDEKENVCFVATMVMGVGTSLADEDDATTDEPQAKKTKTS